MAALDRTAAPIQVAAIAGAISLAGAIAVPAHPIFQRARIFPATPAAEATAVGEAAMAAAEEAISGRRSFTKTGIAAELFPKLFRFIPVSIKHQFGIT